MKTKLIFSMFMFMMICTVAVASRSKVKGYAELKGNSLTGLGNYQIFKSDNPLVFNGQEAKTYELQYDNASKKVLIGVVPEKKCRNFIVKTDLFEIEYVCNKGVFGVKKITSGFSSIDSEKNEQYLDRMQYFTQRVISQSPKSEGELLGLIACYFPQLIKEKYLGEF